MAKSIYVLNGPNLNLLGRRQPDIYGRSTLADVEALCRARAQRYDLAVTFRQSNHEGDIVDWLQEARQEAAGVIINPAIAEGQIVGGALHGLGGALWEELFYDGEGQFLSGSFMDYLVPSASEAPAIEVAHLATPSPFTTLGAKGLGEASSMTAPAVVANAVSDALAPLGVRINELPITPSGLWHLLDRAERQRR